MKKALRNFYCFLHKYMNFEPVSYSTEQIKQQASTALLKNALDAQQAAVMKLFESLPPITDPALGNIIDTWA